MSEHESSQRKAIFITGGASGIGRAIAQRFAKGGWFVGIGDVDEAGMTETEHLIANGFTFSHKFDVRDREAWDEALDAFSMAAGGRIDAVVNNAGIPLGGSLDQNSVAEIERLAGGNYNGRAMRCCLTPRVKHLRNLVAIGETCLRSVFTTFQMKSAFVIVESRESSGYCSKHR